MRVLLQNSHHQSGRPDGWSGAPDEARYVTFDLNPRIAAALAAKGVTVNMVDGDMQDHPSYQSDYDAFVAPHYEADIHYSLTGLEFVNGMRCGLVPIQFMIKDSMPTGDVAGHVGGWFWGRASASLTAAKDDKLGKAIQDRYIGLTLAKGYTLPYRGHWNNPNVTDYYAFRSTTAQTPGVLLELGVGSPTPHNAQDHNWLRNNVDEIAQSIAAGILDYLGIATPVPVDTSKAVLGVENPTAEDLMTFAKLTNPSFPEEWAELYARLAPIAGIRTTVAFSQMVKETNYARFTGTAKVEWNNPAGLGVTGATDAGNRFPTKEAGVRAHLGHLLWYFGTHKAEFCDIDQRHFGGHKNLPNDITQLNGKWAVPGVGYGESILDYAAKIVMEDDMDRAKFDQWFNENLDKYKTTLQRQIENEIVQKKDLPRLRLTLPPTMAGEINLEKGKEK